MSNVTHERLALVQAVEQKFNFTIKKSASSTGGLSVSNEDKRANGFAHLLCSAKNFQAVLWVLKDSTVIEIPQQFQEGYDFTSFLYACGSAPRIVKKGSKHVSKDAVKMGLSQEFVQWAQATRIAGVGGQAGLSRSVKEALQDNHRYGVLDEFGNIVASSDEEAARMKAAQEQLDFQKLADGGQVSQFLQEATNGFTSSLAAKIAAAMAAKQKATAPAPKVEPPKVLAKPKVAKPKVSHFVAYLPGVKKAPPAVQKKQQRATGTGRKGRK